MNNSSSNNRLYKVHLPKTKTPDLPLNYNINMKNGQLSEHLKKQIGGSGSKDSFEKDDMENVEG